jgi:hypothetical protein
MDKPGKIASHLARNLASLRHSRGLTQAGARQDRGAAAIDHRQPRIGRGQSVARGPVKVATELGVLIDELLSSPRERRCASGGQTSFRRKHAAAA